MLGGICKGSASGKGGLIADAHGRWKDIGGGRTCLLKKGVNQQQKKEKGFTKSSGSRKRPIRNR